MPLAPDGRGIAAKLSVSWAGLSVPPMPVEGAACAAPLREWNGRTEDGQDPMVLP
jgi:hypothetical protein